MNYMNEIAVKQLNGHLEEIQAIGAFLRTTNNQTNFGLVDCLLKEIIRQATFAGNVIRKHARTEVEGI